MATIEHSPASTSQSRLVRALYLIFFMLAFGAGQSVLGLITVVQFVWLLAAGEPNQALRRFGASLARWFADTVRFLTCASDDKPFPWREWPSADISGVTAPARL
jgi:Domain of unknown function (DUF4389)